MEEFTVSTYSEYAAATAQIYGEHTAENALIVFRGQSAEYRLPDGRLAIVPSAFRATHSRVPDGFDRALSSYFEAYLRTADDLTRTLFEKRFDGNFETFIRGYGHGGPAGPYHASEFTDLLSIHAAFTCDRFRVAVAQHYGLPTGMLDVTTDPDVALWFAVHRYCHGDQGRPAHYEIARGAGHVYVLRAAAEHVVPLSTFFFDRNTRPRRQQAAALFRMYDAPADELRERALEAVPRWAVPQRPAGNTFADQVVARIGIGETASSWVAGLTATHLFPCPAEDTLYAHLSRSCDWVEEFVHCGPSPELPAPSDATTASRSRPVEADRELASDPAWFTVLLLGDDAPAAYEYAWRFSYTGSPLGVVNLFDKQGLNLIVVTVDEAKELILQPGVAAILFCDVGGALVRDGTADDICRWIVRSGKVVVPAYSNLDEHERRFSEAPFELLPENALSEGNRITKAIRSAIEMSWQLGRADRSSPCRKQFSDRLHAMFR